MVKVHFPRQDGWKGRPVELEVHGPADSIRPGATVRVQAGVTEPTRGWGKGMTHASVGLVRAVRHDGVAIVRFPAIAAWKGNLSELEVVEPVSQTRRANIAANPWSVVSPPTPPRRSVVEAGAAAVPSMAIPCGVPCASLVPNQEQVRASFALSFSWTQICALLAFIHAACMPSSTGKLLHLV
jgi:hypothetical protein